MKHKAYTAVFLMIFVSLVVGYYLYPQLPDRMASHWNAYGEVDGYMDKFWGVFLIPIVATGLLLFFMLIPRIDPLKKNIDKFRKYYNGFIFFVILFLFYVHTLSLLWSMGHEFDMTKVILPAVGLLFYLAGGLMSHAKRNWFIGIRTPWTLSSDEVWDKTHAVGSVLFKILGLITVLVIFVSDYAVWFILVPTISATVYLFVYSYFEHKKLKNGTQT